MNNTQQYTTTKAFKFLGFNDDQCSCDVCGKEELKGTYALEDYTNGDIIRAGSVCGARMLGWSVKEFNANFKNQKNKDRLDANAELRASIEYLNYTNAMDFLNKESDEIERKIFATGDQQQRTKLHNTRRTFESRMEYLEPVSKALDLKRAELIVKYNLPKNTFLN